MSSGLSRCLTFCKEFWPETPSRPFVDPPSRNAIVSGSIGVAKLGFQRSFKSAERELAPVSAPRKMSQKTTRRTTQLSQVQTTILTSGSPESSSALTNTRSPFSPTCVTRLDEKNQLQHLNDRLAQYIERVRSLETENQRLSVTIRSSEEKLERTCSGIKDTYERELADARRLNDELASQKARLLLDLGKKTKLLEDIDKRLAGVKHELEEKTARHNHMELELSEAVKRREEAMQKYKALLAENKALKDENASLSGEVKKLETTVENESLLRVDLNNKVTSLRDELTFARSLHEKEISEARSQREVVVTEVNEQLDTEYKQKLQEELAVMRRELDAQIKASRKEIEDMYENKLMAVRAMADSNQGLKNKTQEELQQIRVQLTVVESQRGKLADELVLMQKKYQEAEVKLAQLKDDLQSKLVSKDAEIRSLRDEINTMMKEYKDLSDMKVSMSMEIEAYRRLLEGGEKRLNISPPLESDSSLGRRPTKRRRLFDSGEESDVEALTTTEADAKGDLQVSDHDAITGRSVTLYNSGDEDVPLAGWTLSRKAGGSEVTYKFHPKIVLKAKKKLTVWSSNSGVEHRPPNDLVMKNQNWPCGSRVRSTLINADNEGTAWLVTSVEKQVHKRSASGCYIM